MIRSRLGWATALLIVVAGRQAVPDEPPADAPITPLSVAGTWHIDHPTHHVQGLCVDDAHFWISSVDRAAKRGFVYRIERATLTIVAQRELAEGARFHPGGVQYRDNRLWVPLAEYRPRSSTTVLCLDATTLATVSSFEVADHLGAIAVDDRGQVYGANWDSRQLYVFASDGRQLDRFDSPTGVAYQDLEWHNGHLWAAGSRRTPEGLQAVIDVIDLAERKLVRRYLPEGETATAGRNFCREGFSLWNDACWLMPEDGPQTRVYRLPLPAAAGG